MNLVEHFGKDIRHLIHATTSTIEKVGVLCEARTEQIKLGGITREEKALLDTLLVRAELVTRKAQAIAQKLSALDDATDSGKISANT